MKADAGTLGFTKYKSRWTCSWLLANLASVGDHPHVSSFGRPFEGRTVFVVGAGPSLAGNIDMLKIHAGHGHPVVCVNAAGAPLKKAGIRPDVFVARESLDLTDQIEATDARMIALDVSAHPYSWKAAGGRATWFVPGYPRQIDIALRLGVLPLFGGPAALCTAVALSLEWGASRVVLVGCDLAFRPDGQAYHPDAPRGTLRFEAKGEGETARVEFSGDEQDDERCERSGQEPPPKTVRYQEVVSWDWSCILPTINVYQDQRTWLSIQADRHGGDVELVNATEGGSGVPGWRCEKLVAIDAPAQPEVILEPTGYVSQERVADAREWTRQGLAVLEQEGREMLSRAGPDLRVLASIPGIAMGSPIGEALSAWRLIEVRGQPEDKIRQTYEALRDAGAEGQRILSGRA